MSGKEKSDIIGWLPVILAPVLVLVLVLAVIGAVLWICWAGSTGPVVILRGNDATYSCQTSRLDPTPHQCKPIKGTE